MGFFAGLFIGISRIIVNYTLSIGPAGGTMALSNISGAVFFIAAQAIKNKKWIRLFELIGALIAILGCLLLSIPEKFIWIFEKLRCKNKI